MKLVKTTEAVGQVLCHDITQFGNVCRSRHYKSKEHP